MEDEAIKMQPRLTSTANIHLSENNDKNDANANDSTPTSSTDAASSYSTSLNVTDDPISSTSSDVVDKNKAQAYEKFIIEKKEMDSTKILLGTEGEVDLLDISMENASSEPINEDVEDIVQDLENLLGESDDFTSRRKEVVEEVLDEVISESLGNSIDEKSEVYLPTELEEIPIPNIEETNILSKDIESVIENLVVVTDQSCEEMLVVHKEQSPVSNSDSDIKNELSFNIVKLNEKEECSQGEKESKSEIPSSVNERVIDNEENKNITKINNVLEDCEVSGSDCVETLESELQEPNEMVSTPIETCSPEVIEEISLKNEDDVQNENLPASNDVISATSPTLKLDEVSDSSKLADEDSGSRVQISQDPTETQEAIQDPCEDVITCEKTDLVALVERTSNENCDVAEDLDEPVVISEEDSKEKSEEVNQFPVREVLSEEKEHNDVTENSTEPVVISEKENEETLVEENEFPVKEEDMLPENVENTGDILYKSTEANIENKVKVTNIPVAEGDSSETREENISEKLVPDVLMECSEKIENLDDENAEKEGTNAVSPNDSDKIEISAEKNVEELNVLLEDSSKNSMPSKELEAICVENVDTKIVVNDSTELSSELSDKNITVEEVQSEIPEEVAVGNLVKGTEISKVSEEKINDLGVQVESADEQSVSHAEKDDSKEEPDDKSSVIDTNEHKSSPEKTIDSKIKEENLEVLEKDETISAEETNNHNVSPEQIVNSKINENNIGVQEEGDEIAAADVPCVEDTIEEHIEVPKKDEEISAIELCSVEETNEISLEKINEQNLEVLEKDDEISKVGLSSVEDTNEENLGFVEKDEKISMVEPGADNIIVEQSVEAGLSSVEDTNKENLGFVEKDEKISMVVPGADNIIVEHLVETNTKDISTSELENKDMEVEDTFSKENPNIENTTPAIEEVEENSGTVDELQSNNMNEVTVTEEFSPDIESKEVESSEEQVKVSDVELEESKVIMDSREESPPVCQIETDVEEDIACSQAEIIGSVEENPSDLNVEDSVIAEKSEPSHLTEHNSIEEFQTEDIITAEVISNTEKPQELQQTDEELTKEGAQMMVETEDKITNSVGEKEEIPLEVEQLHKTELIPVVEEECVKKTIIYEHHCTHEDLEEDKSSNKLNEEILDEVKDLKPSNTKSSHIIKEIEVMEQESNKIEEESAGINSQSLEQLPVVEVDEKSVESKIEDQTTAAVQSILDNMLEENNAVEITSSKEAAQTIHSTYSSYELQKAVQQIQNISETQEPEDICNLESFVDSSNNGQEVESTRETEQEQHEVVFESKEEISSEEITSKPIEDDEILNSEVDSKCNAVEIDSSFKTEEKADEIEEVAENIEESRAPPVQLKPNLIVEPSIDLSEESSSEYSSEEEKGRNKVTSTVISDDEKKPKSQKVEKSEAKKVTPRETRHSSRISEKIKEKPVVTKEKIDEPLSISIEESDKGKVYSPKVTIKPIKEDENSEDREEHKGSLKITITKQSDNTHSILKICSPEAERVKQNESDDQNVIPKLVIKTSESDQHSPKLTRSCKQISMNSNQRSGSPRITIKPIVKPDAKEPALTSPLKITIKPLGKPEEFSKQQQSKHSPKLSKTKAEEDHYGTRSKVLKSAENSEVHSPKVTIKPVVKHPEEISSTPKITIKPIEKPEAESKTVSKVTIKPVVKPTDLEPENEEEIKERIVLKINKGTIPNKDTDKTVKDSRKREAEDDKSEKLAKIKLKFSKGGDAHIVHDSDTEKHVPTNKRNQDFESEKVKRLKTDNPGSNGDDDVKIIEDVQSPIVISEDSRSQEAMVVVETENPEVKKTEVPVAPVPTAPRKRGRPRKVPLVAREEYVNPPQKEELPNVSTDAADQSTEQKELTGRPKRSCRGQSVRDTLGIKPRKPKGAYKPRAGRRGSSTRGTSMKSKKGPGFSEAKLDIIKSTLTEEALRDARKSCVLKVSGEETEHKKVKIKPLELKGLLQAAKDQNIIEVVEIDTPNNSPGAIQISDDAIKTDIHVLDIIPEKSGSSDENKGECSTVDDANLSKDELSFAKESTELGVLDSVVSDVEMQPPTPVFAPPVSESSVVDITHSTDIAMFEEETRMSAETCSRAQTPAKQVVSADVVVEESQSSVQSTATTESGKISKKGRLEVHQDLDGSVCTADQLNEYYWNGNGPFMIQEQVAQFLGIKSFKRKYPGIPRRMVDMQERDYIRENGLASESMCDLGLTAVNSADILDIMYSDFQEKYEEYCKYQRDRQAKDLLNKQKAMSLASSQEKSKLDIIEQAVHSAAAFNSNFNKVRKEQRRACMDLQSMNIHYPKNRVKQLNVTKIGHYPVVVVPGQYTDYYREFTPTELNNLPLNTMLYTELHKILPEISDSDSDSSGSDSDDSSSSGSDSDSSCGERCKICNNSDKKSATPRKSPIYA